MKQWSDVEGKIRSVSELEKEEIRQTAAIVATLATRRSELGWSQRDLAAKANIKQSALSRLESGGAIPRLDTLSRVALALGMSLSLSVDHPDTERNTNV
jgi:transcriptional regulator with XRE-family HTH domain